MRLDLVLATSLALLPLLGATGEPPAVLLPDGVEVAPGTWAELPAPVLRLDADQAPDELAVLAGAAGWERFAADSVSAPVTVSIEPVTAAGSRLGHRVRTAFCLHAPLDRLRADETLARSLGADADEDAQGAAARELTAEELREAGITPDPAGHERLVSVEIPLLNRVIVRGVVRAELREQPAGIEVAWQFDPRLADHPRWGATWTRLTENELGERVPGPAQPYQGCGGVVTVRKLGDDLLVVESRMVIAEPEGWFQGSNLLRSKIPLTTQEGVRTLRRRLAAAR